MVTKAQDPLSQSLLGEYLRQFLVATAGCSAMASAALLGVKPISFMLVFGNILVLASLFSSRFAGRVRGTFLAFCASLVTLITMQSDDPNRWWSPVMFFSPASLLTCLVLLMVRDFIMALPGIVLQASFRSVGITIGTLVLLIYFVLVPTIAVVVEQLQDKPVSYALDELTFFEQFRVRSSKFIVFAVFTYSGACVASFVNVVASSAPRGGAIALRTSACPKCGVPIRRIDNLPIFSYLNLSGRCRNCAAVIPVRYVVVEVVGAVIFGGLFLFELVTGASNIPGFQEYTYTGIVWIILYTKWPVVGIYLYHAALFSCLMMLALMDFDRLRCPKWLFGLLVAAFAGLSIFVPTLQPVPFFAQIGTDPSSSLPPLAIRSLTCLIGGTVGWFVTLIVQRMARLRWLRRFAGYQLPLSGAMIGIALGWQATLTIVAFGTIASAVLLVAFRRKRLRRYSATAFLSFAAFLHQPFWKLLANLYH